MRVVPQLCLLFFFNDTATTEIYTLSLHDALPIWNCRARHETDGGRKPPQERNGHTRSEEHTSELQSPCNLVCRLLLEKKNLNEDETTFAESANDGSVRLRLKADYDTHTRAPRARAANVFDSLFFFNDAAPTEIYPLSLHGALPISVGAMDDLACGDLEVTARQGRRGHRLRA